jgi:hypothetical protein
MMTRSRSRTVNAVSNDVSQQLPPEDYDTDPITTSSSDDTFNSDSDDDNVIVPFVRGKGRGLLFNDPLARLEPDQINRVKRMYADPLYLIDVSKSESDETKYTFKISGSTSNLYTITINTLAETHHTVAACDCPDASIGAKFRKCHCKHVCFVLLRACRLDPSFLAPGPIRARQELINGLALIDHNRNWGGLTNDVYVSTYKRAISHTAVDNNIAPFDIPEDFNLTDDCSICLDNQGCRSLSSMCPQCNNCFHKNCIAQWLIVSRAKCPLCRGSWKGYDRLTDEDEFGTLLPTSAFMNLQQLSTASR